MSQFSLVVIGGGAAGFFAAINTAILSKGNKQILILEKSDKILSKVKISGGGRCNVTNAAPSLKELLNGYPRGEKFLRNVFQQFNNQDTRSWFENLGCMLKTEDDSRVFPQSNSSQSVIDLFLSLCLENNIEIQTQKTVLSIEKKENWIINLSNETEIEADNILMACGGSPSINGYDWLRNLDLKINQPYPSLFTFNSPKNLLNQLMGVSVDNAITKIVGTKFQENGPLLITHWGLSGPAILKLSSWAAIDLAKKNYQYDVSINWIGIGNEDQVRNYLLDFKTKNHKKQIGNYPQFNLPSRLWEYFLSLNLIKDDTTWSEISHKEINKLIETLMRTVVSIKGKTTFKEEFVTCGGIDLSEIDVKTMMAKKHPNLYFAGEILDIDGITGGYNFQAAWSTAWVASKNIGQD